MWYAEESASLREELCIRGGYICTGTKPKQ